MECVIIGTCRDSGNRFVFVDKNCKDTQDMTLYTVNIEAFDIPKNSISPNDKDCDTDYFGKTFEIKFSLSEPMCKLKEGEDAFLRAKNIKNVLSIINNKQNINTVMLILILTGTYTMLRREISNGCNQMKGNRSGIVRYAYGQVGQFLVESVPCANKELELALYKDSLKMPLGEFIDKWQVYKEVYENKYREELKRVQKKSLKQQVKEENFVRKLREKELKAEELKKDPKVELLNAKLK